MSFFGSLFSSKKGAPTPTPSEAIQKLREIENMLTKKQEFLESKIETEIETAKKHGTKNKRAAIQALKRKKRYEKQLQNIDGTLTTIETQREALENANTNTTVLNTLKNASDALKAAHKEITVDDVHDIMDDIAEQNEIANEISDAVSTAIGFNQDVDEDELERELEELEQEALDEDLLNVPSTTKLPDVPVAEPSVPSAPERVREKKKAVAADIDEEKEMAQLLKWAE